jgi:hypothetical protein
VFYFHFQHRVHFSLNKPYEAIIDILANNVHFRIQCNFVSTNLRSHWWNFSKYFFLIRSICQLYLSTLDLIFIVSAINLSTLTLIVFLHLQFDKDILQICLSLLRKSFGFKMTPSMADPVLVARALSRIVSVVSYFFLENA